MRGQILLRTYVHMLSVSMHHIQGRLIEVQLVVHWFHWLLLHNFQDDVWNQPFSLRSRNTRREFWYLAHFHLDFRSCCLQVCQLSQLSFLHILNQNLCQRIFVWSKLPALINLFACYPPSTTTSFPFKASLPWTKDLYVLGFTYFTWGLENETSSFCNQQGHFESWHY